MEPQPATHYDALSADNSGTGQSGSDRNLSLRPALLVLAVIAVVALAALTNERLFSSLRSSAPSPSSAPVSLAASAPSVVYNVSVSNSDPRRDVRGAILDVHDGNILLHEGRFFYYGAQYGSCQEPPGWSGGCYVATGCGFQFNHNLSLYTSDDLSSWTQAPHPFEVQRDYNVSNTIFLCPKVVYNRLTQQFVLWHNANGGYGIATSPSPYGPFHTVYINSPGRAAGGNGDFHLFVEDEPPYTAYVVYVFTEGIPASQLNGVRVDQLSPDYLSSLGSTGLTSATIAIHNEAPAMFKRDGLYYVSTGPNCCYCQAGGPVTFYVSCHPLGPYVATSVVSVAIPAQQTDILRYVDGAGEEQFIWRGDRWQQSPDGEKGHDPTYVSSPIKFDRHGVAAAVSYESQFTLSVDPNGSIPLRNVSCRLPVSLLRAQAVDGFEVPRLSGESNPDSVGFILSIPSTPWSWSPFDAGGGYGRSGGPFWPLTSATEGLQFAYLRSVDGAPASMAAQYHGLSAGAAYSLSFTFSTREVNSSAVTGRSSGCQLELWWDGVRAWSSARELQVEARWHSVSGLLLSSPASGSASVNFTLRCGQSAGTFAFLIDQLWLQAGKHAHPAALAFNNGSVYSVSPLLEPSLCWLLAPSSINSSDALIQLLPCSSSASSPLLWRFEPSGWLTSVVSGMHVNVRGECAAVASGRALMQYDGNHQQPEMNEVLDFYSPTFRLTACGMCIVASDGLTAGSGLQLQACTDGDDGQRWRLSSID